VNFRETCEVKLLGGEIRRLGHCMMDTRPTSEGISTASSTHTRKRCQAPTPRPTLGVAVSTPRRIGCRVAGFFTRVKANKQKSQQKSKVGPGRATDMWAVCSVSRSVDASEGRPTSEITIIDAWLLGRCQSRRCVGREDPNCRDR
jgi:hypothetical protein